MTKKKQERRFRNEWKFGCNDAQLSMLASRLEGILPLDDHTGPDHYYLIRSVYFDDWNNSAASDTEGGYGIRGKWRVRSYGQDMDHLYLEKKDKVYGRCCKESCPITSREMDLLTGGNAAEVVYASEQPLIRRFGVEWIERILSPRAIIEYERTAYVDQTLNIRVTFDRNITVAAPDSEITIPVTPASWHILEVKFDEILPSYLKQMICSDSFLQQTFSKYYLGRKALEAQGLK